MSKNAGPDEAHQRPDGCTTATVAATGKLSEALETVERARGHLYEFHQLMGGADLTLGEAVDQLHDAGHDELASELQRVLVGRNVIPGRWTFQVVEEFDDYYWSVFREQENAVRDALLDGRRHLYEAEMKEDRRSDGQPGHEAVPRDA